MTFTPLQLHNAFEKTGKSRFPLRRCTFCNFEIFFEVLFIGQPSDGSSPYNFAIFHNSDCQCAARTQSTAERFSWEAFTETFNAYPTAMQEHLLNKWSLDMEIVK